MSATAAATFFKSVGEDKLKTQKLLYYAQGLHLLLFDEPLFEEDIRAWKLGPVVPEAYHGWGQLPESQPLPPHVRVLLEDVREEFKDYSGSDLVSKTHAEQPWKDTWEQIGMNGVITLTALQTFFNAENFPVAIKRHEARETQEREELRNYIERNKHRFSDRPPKGKTLSDWLK